MKKYSFFVLIAIAIYAIVFIIASLVLYSFLPGFFPAITYVFLALWILLTFNEIKMSWVQIHKPYVMVLEEKGRFSEILRPGLYFVFQRFGLFTFPRKKGISLAEKSIPFEVEIPFKSVIARLEAEIIIKVDEDDKSIENSVYVHDDPEGMIISGSKASLRHFFSQYSVDDAFKKKGVVNLDIIFKYLDPDKDKESEKWEETEFGKRVISCGRNPINFKILSINLDKDVAAARQAPYKEKQLGQARVKKAEASKKARSLEGSGEEEFIKKKNSGIIESAEKLKKVLGEEQAASLLTNIEYYEALKEADNVVVVSGSHSAVDRGAELAVGMGALTKKAKEDS